MRCLKPVCAALSLLLLVTSCANPVVAPPVTPSDAQKSCSALEADIVQTAQLKRDARAEDEFRWYYVFLLNAGTSWYRMNKAENAAEERLAQLNRIAAEKGCLGNQNKAVVPPNTPVTPAPVRMPAKPITPAPVR